MKKIIEFIPKMSDGGAETLVKDYCLLLNKEMFDVEIMTVYMEKGSANKRLIDKNHVKQFSVFSSHSLLAKVLRKLFGKWYIPYKVKKHITKEKPDVIHAHLETLQYLNAIKKYLKGVKIIYTCHSVPTIALAGKKEAEGNAAKSLIKDNHLQLIALHEEMRKALNEMFCIDDTIVVHNGINLDRFKHVTKSKSAIREDLRIPSDAFVLGHIGRFIECKNHKLIVEIFHAISQKKENAFLLLIGSGQPLKGEVENKLELYGLKNKTLFLENRTDIPELLKAMDVFVFPSFYEGFPVTLIEAQSVGLRCIVSNAINDEVCIADDIVKIGLNENVDTWVNAILQKSSDDETSNDALESFDMNKVILNLQKLYITE